MDSSPSRGGEKVGLWEKSSFRWTLLARLCCQLVFLRLGKARVNIPIDNNFVSWYILIGSMTGWDIQGVVFQKKIDIEDMGCIEDYIKIGKKNTQVSIVNDRRQEDRRRLVLMRRGEVTCKKRERQRKGLYVGGRFTYVQSDMNLYMNIYITCLAYELGWEVALQLGERT